MKISTKGRYAVRVMLDLAINDDGNYITLKEISARQDVTIKYLEQIISLLSKNHLVFGMRGTNGGYKLVKKASEYTMGEILRASEGCLSPIGCIADHGFCERAEVCPHLPFWKGLSDTIINYVDNYTLEDLVNQHLELKDKLSNLNR